MTKESLAQLLHDGEYGVEIATLEEAEAKKHGLIVLFGASDDLAEFRGAFHDELDCYEGGDLYLDSNGVLLNHQCDCDYCGYKDRKAKAKKIEAIWGKDGYSWTYKTDIPHATFDVSSEDGKYCRGIVFSVKDLC